MTKIEMIEKKAQELQELKRLREELDAEITVLEDGIKAEMGDETEIVAGPFKILWKTVTSSRFDTAAFKKALPEVAARFMKDTTVRRFNVI